MTAAEGPLFTFLRPELVDKRGDAVLLAWGCPATWIAADDELVSLLSRFDGETPASRVVADHAAQWRKSVETVAAEAAPILEDMIRRGVLLRAGTRPEEPREPVEVANITVNVTNRCNLACPFCYNDNRSSPPVPVEDLVRFFERGRGVISADSSLILLGGEPFLEPDRLLAIIDEAGEVFSSPPAVSTNGTLLTPEMARELARRRVEVQVSIDAPRAELHDRHRGAGVFDKAVRAVRELAGAGVHTILSMVYTAETACEMEAYLELARSLGAAEARFIPLRRTGVSDPSVARLLPDQLLAFENLVEVARRRPELRSLLGRDFFSIATELCRRSSPRESCGIARRVLFVDADGSIYPCPNHATAEHRVGDVRADTLGDVMLKSPLVRALRQRYTVSRYTACRRCPFRGWCAGDCRGEVLNVTGDPLAPSPSCARLKEMYKQILWMLAEGTSPLGHGASANPGC